MKAKSTQQEVEIKEREEAIKEVVERHDAAVVKYRSTKTKLEKMTQIYKL